MLCLRRCSWLEALSALKKIWCYGKIMFVMGKMAHGKGAAERGKALDVGTPCPTAALAPSSSHHGQERLAHGAGDAPQPREEPGTCRAHV